MMKSLENLPNGYNEICVVDFQKNKEIAFLIKTVLGFGIYNLAYFSGENHSFVLRLRSTLIQFAI